MGRQPTGTQESNAKTWSWTILTTSFFSRETIRCGEEADTPRLQSWILWTVELSIPGSIFPTRVRTQQQALKSNMLAANSSSFWESMRIQTPFSWANKREEFSRLTRHTATKEAISLGLQTLRDSWALTLTFTKTTIVDGKEIGKNPIQQLGCGPLDGAAGNTTSYLARSQQSLILSNGSQMWIRTMKRRLLCGMLLTVLGRESGFTTETTCILWLSVLTEGLLLLLPKLTLCIGYLTTIRTVQVENRESSFMESMVLQAMYSSIDM